jgi:Tfp pilus assembly protein PilV
MKIKEKICDQQGISLIEVLASFVINNIRDLKRRPRVF